MKLHMLSTIVPSARHHSNLLLATFVRHRAFTTNHWAPDSAAPSSSSASSSPIQTRNASQTASTHPGSQSNPQPSYHIPRNSRGSLPVYSDIRNGGTRYQVLVRNVQGNTPVSANIAPAFLVSFFSNTCHINNNGKRLSLLFRCFSFTPERRRFILPVHRIHDVSDFKTLS